MNRFIHKYFLISVLLFSVLLTNAQRKKGTWQDYLSYINATKVALSNNKVFCVTNGGLFYFDRQDNSINKLSGAINLSDFGIKTIAYNKSVNVLVVAYTNSNIDLVYESAVFNISDIKRKQITGDKSINNITFFGNEAYLSCGFGIVVLNLEKKEIKNTYFITDGGTNVSVNDVESDNQFLYAATDNGILKADLNSNLFDYQNWEKIENIPHANEKFSHLAFHANTIIANYTPGEQVYNSDELYELQGENWQTYQPRIKYAHDIQTDGNYLVIASRAEIFIIDNTHSLIGIINAYNFDENNKTAPYGIKPRSAVVSEDGNIWVADYENSMVKISGENFESIFPNGPFDNYIYSLHQFGSDLWIAPGNKTGWESPRFQRFGNSQWKYFTKTSNPELDGFFNILDLAVDPLDETHFFATSWGGGLLEYKNDEFVNRYTHINSALQTALPPDEAENYIRIGGIDFDSEGNLWLTNSEVPKNVIKRTPQGDWETFVLPEVANKRSIGKILVTQNDDKWILVPSGHDAYVVDKTGAQIKRLLVTSYFNNGVNEIYNRMNDVYSIAEDNEGAIWIGTSKGIAVYSNPQRIWSSESFYASQPSLDLNDGLYHPILETETVTAIAVDGANRKWIGTKNSGVYLISESGENEILHFTENNSPLLSNTITAITLNHKNGEVFFGTEDGLISYQGDAIEGTNSYANVYAYPNPVRETYDGPITVTGLIENTDVKITDISGNLVFQTESLGGQAIWNGKNLNGNRVKTGVYLVFCNNENGEETNITKLLVIH